MLLYLLEGRLFSLNKLLFKDFYDLKYLNLYYINLNIFIGLSFLERYDGDFLINSLLIFLKKLYLSYSCLHIITKDLGRLISSELGGFSLNSYNLNKLYSKFFIYLCGVDLDKFFFVFKNTFIVFQGFFFSNKLIKHVI